MTELKEETPKVLDDLRRRRLAYFESGPNGITSSTTDTQADFSSPVTPSKSTHSINHVDILAENQVEKLSSHERSNDATKEVISLKQSVQPSTDKNELHIQEKNNNDASKSSIRSSSYINDGTSLNTLNSLPLKTSSFSINYEHVDKNYKSTIENRSEIIAGDGIPRSSVEAVGNTEHSTGDDGYNETVERLIKATKEELLGLKSSDDIWSNIWKTKQTDSNQVNENEKSVNNKQKDSNKNEIDHTKDEIHKRSRRSNSESDSHPTISGSASQTVRPRLLPQNSVPSSTDLHPIVSHTRPSLHKPETEHRPIKPNPVEELFSSEQVTRSMVPPQYTNIVGSVEMEGLVPGLALHEQSLDLSDLGLSTHRPDSSKSLDVVQAEADDINLSDTVTQELRTLLGEDKFKQFLVKSKRDLEDLQQDRMSDVSNGSARKDKTPRLLKDRPVIPKKPNTPKSDRKHMQTKTGMTNKTSTVANSNSGRDIKIINQQNIKQKKENEPKKSIEFTPRSPDSEVVNNLIGKYVLNNSDEKKKVNSHSDGKTITTQYKTKEDNILCSSKLVPELNLETLQNDSPRPKLNRPKHEPPTIYFEKQKPATNDQSSAHDSSDRKLSPGRNYDQVTVPRHVAFSADEIYHQAYGAFYPGQTGAVLMSPSVIDYRQDQPQGPAHGIGIPLTPKTPTESVPIADRAGYHQYYVGYKPQGQAYPTVPGMIHPGTPHEATPHTYPQEMNIQQYNLNSARQAAEASQPIPQPPPYNMYNPMYNIPAEYRGYPPGIMSSASNAMTPPNAFGPPTPPTGMIPQAGMVPPSSMPHPLVTPTSMTPTMGVPQRYPVPAMSTDHHGPLMPHPPVSSAANHMPGQPAMHAMYSGAPGMPMGYPGYSYPLMVMAPHPPAEPPATPTTPVPHPQGSTTSHVEVQTEEKHAEDDKATIVEESTFTSVSQIKVEEDMLVPHPPATKKGSRSSPRKHNKVPSANEGQGQQKKRHIEGIRHHHEQKRQQQEEDRLTEEQMVEKQRKFAKQSLERYFSSLENLYMSSSHRAQRDTDSTDCSEAEHPGAIEKNSAHVPEEVPKLDIVREDDCIVDDVISELSEHGHNGFIPYVHGFKDFGDNESDIVMEKNTADHSNAIEKNRTAKIPDEIPKLDAFQKDDSFVEDVASELSDHDHTGFNPVVHGFMDFYEIGSKVPLKKKTPNHPVTIDKSRELVPEIPKLDIRKSESVDKTKNEQNNHDVTGFNPVAHGFMDFSAVESNIVTNKKSHSNHIPSFTIEHENIDESKANFAFHLDTSKDKEMAKETEKDIDECIENETLVNSVVSGVSIKAGGLTERLKDIGIDAHGLKEDDTDESKSKSTGKRREEKKGKVLIVCPDCEGLNKEYMSWCTHCGEIIIGVEPMLVSKNREGKIRMRPYKKPEYDDKPHPAADIHISVKDEEPDIPVEAKQDEDEEEFEKPFTLNLDVIKSPTKDSSDTENASPSKSDGKDSGRPSSDDNDQYKIEQEVVNAICDTITDPVLKGYMKSHFTKKGHTIIDKNSTKTPSYEDFFKKEETPSAFKKDVIIEKMDTYDVDKLAKEVTLEKAIPIKSEDKHSYTVQCVHDVVSYGNIAQHTDSHKYSPEQFAQNQSNTHSLQESKQTAITNQQLTYSSIDQDIPSDNGNLLSSIDKQHDSKQGTLDINKNIASVIPERVDNTDTSVDVDPELDDKLVIPPVPSFSASLPISKGLGDDLRIKIPQNSMDFSEDFSQAGSVVFDTSDAEAVKKAEQKKKEREERRQARRRSKGHGLIDVEVFGYDEMQESRNSSRGLKLVPILNLAGNSSDEDDFSVNSDAKFEPKYEAKPEPDPGYQPANAWDQPHVQEFPESIPEYPEEILSDKQEAELDHHASGYGHFDNRYSNTDILKTDYDVGLDVAAGTQHHLETSGVGPAGDKSNATQGNHQQPTASAIDTGYQQVNQSGDGSPAEENKQEWSRLFDPQSPELDDIPIDPDEEDIPGLDKPFLEQLVSQPTPKKSKRRPQATRTKNVKSVVRKSIEEPGYQRKWARSSTAWSSFNPGELNTSASVQSSVDSSRTRPASAPRSRGQDTRTDSSSPTRPAPAVKGRVSRPASAPKARVEGNVSPVVSGRRQRSTSAQRSSSAQRSHDLQESRVNLNSPAPNKHSVKPRPHSGDLFRRKQSKQKKSKPSPDDLDLDIGMEMIEHRLPRQWMLERLQEEAEGPDHSERVVSPGSTYEKYLQMTPRIEAGTVSRWQCLPDELLLHIFAYLDQTTLTQCAQVCHQYYRVAMDESLWRYITIKKRSDLDDDCLAEVAKRHPISLALIQCNGDKVSAKGLRDLFRECSNCIKELNVSRCSRGALNGDSILLHAAARCHHITHVDTSWCNVTDSGLMAISNCCHRLESLCISGCQAVSNDGIETVIKKHGAQLRVLELFGCFNIGPRGLRCISNNCINLLSLNLGQCYKLTDSCVAQLSSSLGRVENLDLRGLKQIRDNCIRRVVKNCPRLKHLSLANCPSITDVSVLEIATYLTDIRSVDLCGCKNVTDNSIRALVNTCSNLRHIDISSTGCTHRSVSMIANFCGQRLETLKINFLTDVTEQSLIKLAKHCIRLQSVHMYGCTSLRNLDKVKSERPTFTIEM